MSTNRHRMYRSQTGCCICRVKSSSSRFTSSTRYERDFKQCFHVSNRSGDICNACVLLVKRWRNRVDQERHWDYVYCDPLHMTKGKPLCVFEYNLGRLTLLPVVDLRLNPGSRSILKRKKRQIKIENQSAESRKHGNLCSCEMCEGIRSVGNIVAKRRERKRREREEALMENDGFYWRKCIIPCGCGPVLIGRANEIMLDASQMKWCRKPRCHIGEHNDADGSTGTRESSGETGSDSATSPSSNSLEY